MSCITFGKYGQWVAAITVSVSSFVSGAMFAWPSAAIPRLKDGTAGFTLTEDEISLIVSIASISSFLSPIPTGRLMDKYGRRTTLFGFNLVVLLSWVLLAFSSTANTMCFSRFLGGLWGGVEYTAVQIYVGEVVEPHLRGGLGSLSELMLFLGAFFEAIISRLSYQEIVWISAIPSAVLLVGLLCIPESPYYHLMHNDRETATKIVIWLKGTCNNEDMDIAENKLKEQLKNKAGFSEIFNSKPNLKAFIIMVSLKTIVANSGGIILLSFATEVLPNTFLTTQDSYVVLCVVWVVSGLTSCLFIDRFYRRTVLITSAGVTIIAYSFAAVWYYLRDMTAIDTSSTSWVPLLTLSIAGFFETAGIVNVPNIIKSEIFAMNIKSRASALCCMTAFLIEALSSYFFYPITNGFGMYANFVRIVITSSICIIITKFFLIETRGKSLEEIQDILNYGQRVKFNDLDLGKELALLEPHKSSINN